LLPANWNPKLAADEVLASLRKVSPPCVLGAHDSDFLIDNGKAYLVYMANDIQPGESPEWPFVYNALTIVDVSTGSIEATTTFAASEMVYENAQLPVGACFVPRILRKDSRTLRCFFASEEPARRPSQTWFIDFDLAGMKFDWNIYPAEIETDQGIFEMQPYRFHRHVAEKGFEGPCGTYGLYQIDSFKRFDDQVYAVLNNFPNGPSGLAILNDSLDRFKVIGEFFLPHEATLTESAVNRLPDGTWLAVSRQGSRDFNYMFATSPDGIHWTSNEYRSFVPSGANSKPTLDRFGETYYLGWQENTRINGVDRSVFNIDVSRDGANWERKYRFETEKSFQYPVFRQAEGHVYVTVTQGDSSPERKERIMFGRLE